MNYLEELQKIYDSEINFQISCFWDGGWKVELGDEMNGWEESKSTETLKEAVDWLIKTIKKRYPESGYVKRSEDTLNLELKSGEKLARELVLHLNRMGAGQATIPVKLEEKEYSVKVETVLNKG